MSSFVSNALQINFDVVYLLLDDDMVAMFKTLEATGLKGFLGCSSHIYEEWLSQFFASTLIENEVVVYAITNQSFSFNQQQLTDTFGLPTERITEFNTMSSATIEEMKIKFSLSGAPLKSFGNKKNMKIGFRLLSDIAVKPLTAKT